MKLPTTVRGQALLAFVAVLLVACFIGGTRFDLTVCNAVLAVAAVLLMLAGVGFALYHLFRLLYALVCGRWL